VQYCTLGNKCRQEHGGGHRGDASVPRRRSASAETHGEERHSARGASARHDSARAAVTPRAGNRPSGELQTCDGSGDGGERKGLRRNEQFPGGLFQESVIGENRQGPCPVPCWTRRMGRSGRPGKGYDCPNFWADGSAGRSGADFFIQTRYNYLTLTEMYKYAICDVPGCRSAQTERKAQGGLTCGLLTSDWAISSQRSAVGLRKAIGHAGLAIRNKPQLAGPLTQQA
jgi:hypothetical protein